MLRRTLLQLLLVAGIAVNIAFLLINLRPERPHLNRRRHVKVLLRASPPRAKWMMENELSEFAAEHDLDIELVLAKDFDESHDKLVAESKTPSGMVLADTDDEYADDLSSEKAIRPISEGADPTEVTAAMDEYLPDAVERAKVDKKVWFIPKRAQVDIIGYLEPAVEDAYLHWQDHRKEIDAALKEANGYGLPKDYQLERSPESWDSYDVFVAGWTWAHEKADWAEPVATLVPPGAEPPPAQVLPRLAWRTGRGDDATRDLVGAFMRHGMPKATTLENLDQPPVMDALQWRALIRKYHLYAPECEKDGGCDAFTVNKLLHDRKVAYAPINQPDAFWVHGGARRDADPGMRGAGDLAFSIWPAGASLELDDKGHPKRKGKTFSFDEIHLWAAPVNTPDIKLSWELARFLTQRGLQQREAEAEGMLPIRKDLRQNYPVAFRLVWMQNILHFSYRQIFFGSGDTPENLDQIDTKILDMRDRVVASGAVKIADVREAALGK